MKINLNELNAKYEPNVWHEGSDVIFRAGIEIALVPGYRWRDTLIFALQVPPVFGVVLRLGFAAEYVPSILVHHVSEGNEGQFVKSHAHQEVHITLYMMVLTYS